MADSKHDPPSSPNPPGLTQNQERIEDLLKAFRGEDLQSACDAAGKITLLGDRSIVPRLIQEREEVEAWLEATNRFLDASEERRVMGLNMAIIWLLTPEECETLLQTGNEFEKYLVRRKAAVASAEEYWGPISG